MTTADLERIAAFRLAFARRQAAAVTEIPGGVAVRDPWYPQSHEHNQLVLYRAPSAARLPALAEEFLGDLPYRRVTLLDDPDWAAAAPELTEAGYLHATELIMTRPAGAGPFPVRFQGPSAPAGPATLAELRPAVAEELRAWLPDVEDEVIVELVERRQARVRGADEVVFLASRAPDGAVAAWADLYLDLANGIAQIEDVATGQPHRRRGHADRVLAEALRRAARCSLVFLLADPADWPRTWYSRRGFRRAGQSHVFTRVTAG